MKSKDSHAEPVDLMTDMLNEPHQITVADTYEPNVDVVLFDGDCSEFLKDIPSNSVDLIITSPPYNIGKKYEKKTTLHSYLKSQEPVIAELPIFPPKPLPLGRGCRRALRLKVKIDLTFT